MSHLSSLGRKSVPSIYYDPDQKCFDLVWSKTGSRATIPVHLFNKVDLRTEVTRSSSGDNDSVSVSHIVELHRKDGSVWPITKCSNVSFARRIKTRLESINFDEKTNLEKNIKIDKHRIKFENSNGEKIFYWKKDAPLVFLPLMIFLACFVLIPCSIMELDITYSLAICGIALIWPIKYLLSMCFAGSENNHFSFENRM